MSNSEFIKTYLKNFLKYFIIWILSFTLPEVIISGKIDISLVTVAFAFFFASFYSFYLTYTYDDEEKVEAVINRKTPREHFIESKDRVINWSMRGFLLISFVGITTSIDDIYIDNGKFIFLVIMLLSILLSRYNDFKNKGKARDLAQVVLAAVLLIVVTYISFVPQI